jgi:phosphate transport system substrate-binding protein
MKPAHQLKRLSFWSLTLALGGSLFLTGCNSSGSGQSGTDSSDFQSSNSDNTLLGAGSTFVYPLFSKMFSEYNKSTGIKVNYQSIGSGGGILQITNKTVDFGGSDAPLNEEQTKKIGVEMLHIPMASGADVVSYNLPGLNDTLKLTPDVVAAIFMGKITNWIDNAISSINPGVKLPAIPIIVVHRSDGSGTT